VILSLTLTFHAEAAHRLSGLPEGHKCSRDHGHHYTIEYEITAPALDNGMVIESDRARNILAPLIAKIDHHHLNELDDSHPFTATLRAQPTAENLALWLWHRTAGLINNGGRQKIVAIRVRETERLMVEVRP
jgi:6-pyruvoyltetrahydropterin/6-carboxytetrahydropterin synthase